MNPPEEFRSGLEQKVRAEARYGWEKARKQWDRPLPERVLSGRAIGWLGISSVEIVGRTRLVHFHPSADDMALFREGDKVRMSLNDPGGDFIEAMFLGLTEKGLDRKSVV